MGQPLGQKLRSASKSSFCWPLRARHISLETKPCASVRSSALLEHAATVLNDIRKKTRTGDSELRTGPSAQTQCNLRNLQAARHMFNNVLPLLQCKTTLQENSTKLSLMAERQKSRQTAFSSLARVEDLEDRNKRLQAKKNTELLRKNDVPQEHGFIWTRSSRSGR